MGLIEMGGSSSFNKLCEFLPENGFNLSVPTVSKHLKFLVEAGYVKRERKGSQMIIYSVDFSKIGEVGSFWERTKRIAKSIQKNRDEFYSLSEDKQVSNLLSVLIYRGLNEIKAETDFRLDSRSFEKRFVLMFWNSGFLRLAESWVIEKCVKDEVYRKQIFKLIDEWLKKLSEGE
jgi:DNA-binding transcriptional ArsR family regulator